MTQVATPIENSPLVLHLHPVIDLTDEEFFELCQINRDLRIERTATGELLVMSPTSSDTGNRNARLIVQLGIWAERDGTGIYFDSSTGFTLPNGADVSPDAAWVNLKRWNALTSEQQKKFAPICPDFVVELRAYDNLQPLKTKMQEYIDNGALLGFLIDRKNQQVHIYRPGVAVECLDNLTRVSGDPVLPGFVLDLSKNLVKRRKGWRRASKVFSTSVGSVVRGEPLGNSFMSFSLRVWGSVGCETEFCS